MFVKKLVEEAKKVRERSDEVTLNRRKDLVEGLFECWLKQIQKSDYPEKICLRFFPGSEIRIWVEDHELNPYLDVLSVKCLAADQAWLSEFLQKEGFKISTETQSLLVYELN